MLSDFPDIVDRQTTQSCVQTNGHSQARVFTLCRLSTPPSENGNKLLYSSALIVRKTVIVLDTHSFRQGYHGDETVG